MLSDDINYSTGNTVKGFFDNYGLFSMKLPIALNIGMFLGLEPNGLTYTSRAEYYLHLRYNYLRSEYKDEKGCFGNIKFNVTDKNLNDGYKRVKLILPIIDYASDIDNYYNNIYDGHFLVYVIELNGFRDFFGHKLLLDESDESIFLNGIETYEIKCLGEYTYKKVL